MSPELLSRDSYQLLESIFSWEEEIRFLSSQPGYHPRIGINHRKAKRKLAHRFLNNLRADFDGIYREALLLLVDSDVERPDLLRSLWHLKLTFYRRLAIVKVRLLWSGSVPEEIRALSTALEHLIAYNFIIKDNKRIILSET